MIMGISSGLAQQTGADMEKSFIGKRSKIVYPENRIVIKAYIKGTEK
jgi:hypothetical protein